MKYEVRGNEIESIKSCFFQTLKNEKSPAKGERFGIFRRGNKGKTTPITIGGVSPGGTTEDPCSPRDYGVFYL